jgi:hypothetical protein
MRWLTLTTDHLKAAGHGDLIDRARSLATGGLDPAEEAITNATARIHRAIAPGNTLDADATKIPASFKGLAEKLAIYDLMERIGLPLNADQTQMRSEFFAELARTAEHQLKVEQPDNPATSATIQSTGPKISAVNVPERLTGRARTGGL